MTNKEFSELCHGTALLLESLSEQAAVAAIPDNGPLTFDKPFAAWHIKPLADIIAAIAESAK